MLSKKIKLGDRLEISINNSETETNTFTSHVEDVLDKNQIIIHMPIHGGRLFKLSRREEYKVIFFTDKGMYKFEANVLEHRLEDGFNFTVLKLKDKGVKIQRREFFRFTCLIETQFSLYEKNNTADKNIVKVFDGIIKDIGGGGIRFVSNEKLDEEDIVKVIIYLEDELLIAKGRILQCQHFPKLTTKFQYRVEFIGMQKSEQEQIVQYTFEQQRKLLQKTK